MSRRGENELANLWDLLQDLSIDDGSDDQFDGALDLALLEGETGRFPFVGSADTADLTFFGPVMETCTGALTTVSNGALQLSSATSSVSQTVTLPSTVAELRWSSDDEGYFNTLLEQVTTLTVTAGDIVLSASLTDASLEVRALAGQNVTITLSSNNPLLFIDDFKAVDDAGDTVEAIVNGTFTTDLAGWTVAPQADLRNVTTTAEDLLGLSVTRSFFSIPNRKWARHLDTFTNPTAAPITVTVVYSTDLGSDDFGVILSLHEGAALSTWDLDVNDRDVGFVFGAGATHTFTSASGTRLPGSGFDVVEGSEDVETRYTITVEPGDTVALAIFTVLDIVKTGDTATSSSDRPAGVEAVIDAIVAGVRTDGQYLSGLTQAQLDALQNF